MGAYPMSEPDATALEEPIVATKSEPKADADPSTRTRRQPPYHVIILNDDVHTFSYVIHLLRSLFGHTENRATLLAWEVHLQGRAVVLTTHRELAELKRDQVHAFGPDAWAGKPCGPLGCYI